MFEDLITRLETATEGSEELDAAVAAHLVGATAEVLSSGQIAYHRDGFWVSIHPIRPVTRSVDAAMTLLPDPAEWSWKLVYEPEYTAAGPRFCVVLRRARKLEHVAPSVVASKEMLALAICVATLMVKEKDLAD